MKEKNEKMEEVGKINERRTVVNGTIRKEISQSEIFEKQFMKTQRCQL